MFLNYLYLFPIFIDVYVSGQKCPYISLDKQTPKDEEHWYFPTLTYLSKKMFFLN